METATEQTLKAVRTDRGGEYVNKEFDDWLDAKGVEHQRTAGYASEQNGVAERANKTLMERTRASYIRNRSPASGKDKTINRRGILIAKPSFESRGQPSFT